MKPGPTPAKAGPVTPAKRGRKPAAATTTTPAAAAAAAGGEDSSDEEEEKRPAKKAKGKGKAPAAGATEE